MCSWCTVLFWYWKENILTFKKGVFCLCISVNWGHLFVLEIQRQQYMWTVYITEKPDRIRSPRRSETFAQTATNLFYFILIKYYYFLLLLLLFILYPSQLSHFSFPLLHLFFACHFLLYFHSFVSSFLPLLPYFFLYAFSLPPSLILHISSFLLYFLLIQL